MNRSDMNNCPILEVTGDGTSCGRCWCYCPHGICPRHGDVTEALVVYNTTGKLTKETL